MFLAMGGIALGKSVVTSGLLEKMDVAIRHSVKDLTTYNVVTSEHDGEASPVESPSAKKRKTGRKGLFAVPWKVSIFD